MRPFENAGIFWLPESPSHRLSGTVLLDSSGLNLTVNGALQRVTVVPGVVFHGGLKLARHPFVHGQLADGTLVTILDVSGYVFDIPDGVVQEDFRAARLLSGGNVTTKDFTLARFEFDVLRAWAQSPAMVEYDHAGSVGSFDRRRVELAVATWGSLVFTLYAQAFGEANEFDVRMEQRVFFEVAGPKTSLDEIVSGWVRPMQDLLIVALGQSAALTSLTVGPSDPGGPSGSLEVSFDAVQPSPSVLDHARLLSYTSPVLLLGNDRISSLPSVIAEWLEIRPDIYDVLGRLLAPFYAPFMYTPHRYASFFQAAEAMAKLCFDTQQRDAAAHKIRVDRLVALMPTAGFGDEDILWAKGTLRSRNDKTLRRLTEELLAEAGSPGEALTRACPKLPKLWAAARGGASHGGGRGFGALDQYWLGEALLWIVRIYLLREAGVPHDHLEREAMRRGPFQQLLSELADVSSRQG